MILKGGASYLSTRERPGFEIDVRSQRYETAGNGAAEIRVLPKTFVGLRASRTKVDYDQDAVFLGNSLQFALNRTMTVGALTSRYRLTPLTALTVDVGLEQRSVRVLAAPRLRLDPHRGRRQVRAACADQGVGVVRLSRLPAVVVRSPAVQRQRRRRGRDHGPRPDEAWPSGESGPAGTRYELNQPYYVQTGASGSITQHLFGPIDAIARLGFARLDYQNRIVTGPPLPVRTDHMHSFGGGVGYRAARRTRIGVQRGRLSPHVDVWCCGNTTG